MHRLFDEEFKGGSSVEETNSQSLTSNDN